MEELTAQNELLTAELEELEDAVAKLQYGAAKVVAVFGGDVNSASSTSSVAENRAARRRGAST